MLQSWQAKKVSQNIAFYHPIKVRLQKEAGAVGLQFLRHFFCGERRLCHALESLKANATRQTNCQGDKLELRAK
jgi:hypothetical protein